MKWFTFRLSFMGTVELDGKLLKIAEQFGYRGYESSIEAHAHPNDVKSDDAWLVRALVQEASLRGHRKFANEITRMGERNNKMMEYELHGRHHTG